MPQNTTKSNSQLASFLKTFFSGLREVLIFKFDKCSTFGNKEKILPAYKIGICFPVHRITEDDSSKFSLTNIRQENKNPVSRRGQLAYHACWCW